MAGRLAKWAAMPWQERFRVVSCAVGLPGVHASLWLFGYARTRRLIESLSRRRRPRLASPSDLLEARALAKAAHMAGRHGAVHATCLRQSLLIYGVLRCKRLQPVLQLGMRPSDGPFQAHAWVELDGQYLLPADEGHRPFVSPAIGVDVR